MKTEKFCFTAVFEVDQASFEANPFLIDTHWGKPVASAIGDLTYTNAVLMEALRLVSTDACEKYIRSGTYNCRNNGVLTKDARYEADRWCASCILMDAEEEVHRHVEETRKAANIQSPDEEPKATPSAQQVDHPA